MDQDMPSLAERLIQSNLVLANAIQAQAQSIHRLADAVASLVDEEQGPELPPRTYLNGKPR